MITKMLWLNRKQHASLQVSGNVNAFLLRIVSHSLEIEDFWHFLLIKLWKEKLGVPVQWHYIPADVALSFFLSLGLKPICSCLVCDVSDIIWYLFSLPSYHELHQMIATSVSKRWKTFCFFTNLPNRENQKLKIMFGLYKY